MSCGSRPSARGPGSRAPLPASPQAIPAATARASRAGRSSRPTRDTRGRGRDRLLVSVVTTVATEPVKPRLRGVSHQYAFFVSVGCGVGLILAASGGRARIAATTYGVAVSALLGTSAVYHRHNWRPKARRWMKRLDHSMIFVLIDGPYSPVA